MNEAAHPNQTVSNQATTFRVGPGYVEHWIHQLDHCTLNHQQRSVILSLSEALLSLLRQRDEILRARGEFAPVSTFYPNSCPTQRQQKSLSDATTAFFNQFYVAVDKLANLMKRHSDIFPNVPTSSAAKFIKYLEDYALFTDVSLPLLKSAREYRSILNHSTSFPSFSWHTIALVPYQTRIALIGEKSISGKIANGSAPIDEEESPFKNQLSVLERQLGYRPAWYVISPDEELVCWALCIQLNALIPRIEGHLRNSQIADTCSWELKGTEDDVTINYPIFAVEEASVSTTWRVITHTAVSVDFNELDHRSAT